MEAGRKYITCDCGSKISFDFLAIIIATILSVKNVTEIISVLMVQEVIII